MRKIVSLFFLILSLFSPAFSMPNSETSLDCTDDRYHIAQTRPDTATAAASTSDTPALRRGQQEEGISVPTPPSSPSQFVQAEHLSTPDAHNRFLLSALRKARESVMISTDKISPAKLFGEDIDQVIIAAASRGVRVYIYYKDWRNSVLSREHEKRHAALEKHCARFAKIANHSKCVVQDHTKVAISSNNWLDDTYEGSINRSLVISGLATRTLIEGVWQGIRFYQSIEYDNDAGMAHFLRNRDAFSTGSYQFHPGEFYYTLRTPDAHQQLWEQEILAKAQREILMCSPFIRIEKLKRVLAEAAMRSLEERGVRTHLFTLFDPCSRAPMEKDEIFEYLQMLTRKFPHFSFSPQQNLHAKTLIADDLLCEGSFNLLSAVDDIEHNANNFEMSVAIRGPIAAPFIAAFHESPLGAAVLPMDFFGAPPPGSAAAVTATPAAIASPPAAYTPPRSIVSTIRTPSSSLILSSPSRAFSSSPQHSTPPEIRIFSGRTFYKEGYCATLEGEYIRDLEGRIAYFSTPQIARQVAEEVWKDEGESWDSDDDFFQ